jgi:hypothetical protein
MSLAREIADDVRQYPWRHSVVMIAVLALNISAIALINRAKQVKWLLVSVAILAIFVAVLDQVQAYLYLEEARGPIIVIGYIILTLYLPLTNILFIGFCAQIFMFFGLNGVAAPLRRMHAQMTCGPSRKPGITEATCRQFGITCHQSGGGHRG